MAPALEFIIPAFNAARTIEATLASLTAQTLGNWHAIVVDDGSSDATADIVGGWSDRRVELVRQANAGLSATRNAGLLRGASPAVAFLDADDAVDPRFVELMLASLDRDPGAHIAGCGTAWFGPALDDLGWCSPLTRQDLSPERLARANPLAVGAAVVRREAIDAVQLAPGVWFDPSLESCEDWDLWFRLLSAGHRFAEPVPLPLFRYRLAAGTMSTHVERMWRAGMRVIMTRVPTAGRDAAGRSWSLRAVAGAAAADDAPLVQRLIETLAPRELIEQDRAEFAAVVGSACARWQRLPLWRWPEALRAAWADRLERTLVAAGQPALAEVCRGALVAVADPSLVAQTLARLAGRVVLFGMGRNGVTLAAELRARGVGFSWMDDDPRAACPEPRLGVADLRPGDVVVLTPAVAEPLRARLAGRVPDATHRGISIVTAAEVLAGREPQPAGTTTVPA